MRRFKGFVLMVTVMLLLLSALASAETLWTADPKEVKGGDTMSEAKFISADNYLKVLKVHSYGRYNEYYVEAPADGTYTFTVTPLKYSCVLKLYNERGEHLLDSAEYKPGKSVSQRLIEVKKGEKIWFRVHHSDSNITAYYCLIICFDGYHVKKSSAEVVQEPTCVVQGIKAYRCQYCDGIAEVVEEIPALGHTPGTAQIEKNATCTTAGSLATYCTVCNEILSTSEIPATGHTSGRKEVIQPASCLAAGVEGDLCFTCGEVLSTSVLPITEHSAGQMELVSIPTCTDIGFAEQRCLVCGILLANEELPAYGHQSGVWKDEVRATCTADGLRRQYCERCNVILNTETVPAFGHSVSDWVVTREAACLQSGLKEKLCSSCGIALETESLAALGHHYTEWEILTEATKEHEGEQRRHCIHCGDTQFEKIPKLEKIFGIF